MASFSQTLTTVIICATFWQPFWHCQGFPTYAEQYQRSGFAPEWTDLGLGPQIIAPDTPYIAAAGMKELYFLDIRLDPDSAQHIKNQIEALSIPRPTKRIEIDEIKCTAKVVESSTNKTTFIFDPPYARVFFARQINRWNPHIKLPEHAPAGDWVVAYDNGPKNYSPRGHSPRGLFERIFQYCSDHPCEDDDDCPSTTYINCNYCSRGRIDNECAEGVFTNAAGSCSRHGCNIAVDTLKEEGETNTAYYQRMDELHWGGGE